MNTRYLVGALLLIAASLLIACGARTPAQQNQIEQESAQQTLDHARVACRDHVQYLVYDAGPYVAFTPRVHTDGYPYIC